MSDPIIADQTQDPIPPTFPEMTDFPTIPAVPQDIGTTPQASGPTDIPPIITNSKTPKKKSGKLIATILGIFLLIGAVGAGVVLVGQKQLFKQKAALAEPCKACVGTLCKTIASPPTCSPSLNECNSNSQCTAPTCDKEGDCDCTGNNSYRWFTDPVSKQCALKYDSSCVQECAAPPTSPPTATATPTPNSCSLAGSAICVGNDVTGPCYQGGQGGEYACYKLTGNRGRMVVGTGTQCVHAGGSNSNCVCDTSPYLWKAFENGATWCFDTRTTCDGEGCYTERCSLTPQQCTGGTPTPTPPPGSTPTPTPTPGSAMCMAVKAYDTNWNSLNGTQLSALSAGSVVRFAVSGTPANQIDKARFTINGVLKPETTNKKPGTNEYYYEYTIPAGVVSFTVTAQIHHVTLGWF